MDYEEDHQQQADEVYTLAGDVMRVLVLLVILGGVGILAAIAALSLVEWVR